MRYSILFSTFFNLFISNCNFNFTRRVSEPAPSSSPPFSDSSYYYFFHSSSSQSSVTSVSLVPPS